MYTSPHHSQQQQQSLSALYPQARKLQFELKMQMSYLDTGRLGGKSSDELQSEARENLSQLQQLLWQLDSLVQVYPDAAERQNWTMYVVCMSVTNENNKSSLLTLVCSASHAVPAHDNRKLQQLRNETQGLGHTLEQHVYRASRRQVEARERESLLNRRNAVRLRIRSSLSRGSLSVATTCAH